MKGKDLLKIARDLEVNFSLEEATLALGVALGGEGLEVFEDLPLDQRNRLALAYAWSKVVLEEE